jgi:hypothetical protein
MKTTFFSFIHHCAKNEARFVLTIAQLAPLKDTRQHDRDAQFAQTLVTLSASLAAAAPGAASPASPPKPLINMSQGIRFSHFPHNS